MLPASSQIEVIPHPDFSDYLSLYRQILHYGRWSLDTSAIDKLSEIELKAALKEFFDVSTCLLVIDDVDTLTTKGIDAGFDFLYKLLSRANSGSKIVYTLRNAPSHSLLNSIEVPGLAIGGDYEKFVSACASQFGVEEPKPDFRDRTLAALSERRPLVVEAIIALRRSAGSYKRAAELFEQHAGADVREYVFLREWDALPADGLARLLLIALSEIGRWATFEELETVLQVESTRVRDAIGAVREMFLQIEGRAEDTNYSLAQLTKTFIDSKKSSVQRYDVLKARIKSFKCRVFTASPQVARLSLQIEGLLSPRSSEHSKETANEAWRIVSDPKLPPIVTENPIFRSLKGYVACCLVPPRITDAREAFQYARNMGYEPEWLYLKKWFAAEKANGQIEGGMAVVADTVLRGKKYTAFEKAYMSSGKAAALYFRGRDRLSTGSVDAEKDLRKALSLHLFAYKVYFDHEGCHWSPSIFEYAKNTAFTLFNIPFQASEPWKVFDLIIDALKVEGIYADPLEEPIAESLKKTLSTTRRDLAHRYRNQMKPLEMAVRDAKWHDSAASERIIKSIRAGEFILQRNQTRA